MLNFLFLVRNKRTLLSKGVKPCLGLLFPEFMLPLDQWFPKLPHLYLNLPLNTVPHVKGFPPPHTIVIFTATL